ncbi:MAG TPA: hypothetical protein DDZ51_02620 [Planctomycetaceae bacterium]|nr:hypothetical protein [Planctomycetaceae bacterium]
MPAAKIEAISDRRASADRQEEGSDEPNSHLREKSRDNKRLGDRHSQPQWPRLSVVIHGSSSKRRIGVQTKRFPCDHTAVIKNRVAICSVSP